MRFFKLFSNCIPVKGYSRSIIVDLQRRIYHFAPNSMIQILQEFEKKPYNIVLSGFGDDEKAIINEYISFLEEKEWVRIKSRGSG